MKKDQERTNASRVGGDTTIPSTGSTASSGEGSLETTAPELLDHGCGRCGDVNCFGGCEDEDDEYREPWCRDFEGHKLKHEFCGHHQAAWCRVCDKHGCPECQDDPHCDDCGAALFHEDHNWDCMYAGDGDDC